MKAAGRTETLVLVKAMRELAQTIISDDGVANAAIAEAADRLLELDDYWQPIETAPDGVMLLFANMNAAEARHWAFCGWRHSGMRCDSVQMPDNTTRSATHWRRLPAPPQSA